MATDHELRVHRDWIGLLQPVGLVVSPPALLAAQAFPDKNIIPQQQALLALITPIPPSPEARRSVLPPRPLSFASLATEVLGWRPNRLVGLPGQRPVPDSLDVVLPEFGETLRPTYAVQGLAEDAAPVRGSVPPAAAENWMILIQELVPGTSLDEAAAEDDRAWHASPQARLERLLRETAVPIGLLCNGHFIRLVYAPRGESSGHITWPVHRLGTALDRDMLSALVMLLGNARLFTNPHDQRLPHILKESRKYQNVVSTKLAGQVLEALNELLRGFQSANEAAKGALLDTTVREDPDHVYGGLLAVLLRLVFILYAEERGLLSTSAAYVRNYSLVGLFDKLRIDAGRFPDTMDQRYGAWSRLLVLFRMVHDGANRGDLRLPPRYGHLFDPDGWGFLEGRPLRINRIMGAPVEVPRVADGVVLRVLEKLLLLDSDRLSYRALDVEQIGSVYENMMGFRLERSVETSIGVGKDHVVVGLETLLAKKGAEREKLLKDTASVEVTGKALEALKAAATVDDLVAALSRRISPLTPRTVPAGGLYLQPTDERRRSGSHYTPRELTEPIVRTTLRPILDDLGSNAKPEQVLALKVCDPAMGSGAFLVEACRQLAEQLVKTYDIHGRPTDIPPDEDVLLYAQRQVAQHCLYGVDKNPFAVDLGKLSLWLATLARDHAFTFLDHSIRHGDSLVGLTREQIASFHWAPEKQIPVIRTFVDKAISEAIELRAKIPDLANSDDVRVKRQLLQDADDALAKVRMVGDAVVASFFSADGATAREASRTRWETTVANWLSERASAAPLTELIEDLRGGGGPVPCFHWLVEFPEVFQGTGGGFDALVGNPPFLGGSRLSTEFGAAYENYLKTSWPELVGKIDLVVYFLHRAAGLLRSSGAAAFIATYRVGDGANALIGLRPLTMKPWMIYWAHKERRWPGAAKTRISLLAFRRCADGASFELNGRKVDRIGCDLRASVDLSGATDLAANNDMCFQGANPDSLGFMLSDEERESITSASPAESVAIRRYIVGNDLTTRPASDGSRWIIDFSGLEEDVARSRFPRCFEIVRERVRPSRTPPARIGYREPWWQFNRPQLRAHQTARKESRVLGISRVTKYAVWNWIDPQHVIAAKIAFVASADDGLFGLLHSCFHEYWALRRGGKFGVGGSFSYSHTACFRSFPFPEWPEMTRAAVSEVSASIAQIRSSTARRDAVGLTEIYNRFHDRECGASEIQELRQAHVRLDHAVARAYGWQDLPLNRDWQSTSTASDEDDEGADDSDDEVWRYAIGDESRELLLARLLELNARRAKEQAGAPATAGPATPTAASKKPRGRAKAKRPTPAGQAGLFGDRGNE
jgi:hypothetical protein